MTWSDPFTGWRNGWIGRGAFVGWALAQVGAGIALGILIYFPPGGMELTPTGANVITLLLLLILPFSLNLNAKRFRDIGMRGWPYTLGAAAVDFAADVLFDWGYTSIVVLIFLCVTPQDKFGKRVDRTPKVDPDVFS